MRNIYDFIIEHQFGEKILWTFLYLIVAFVAIRIINKVLYNAIKDTKKSYTIRKGFGYFITTLALIGIAFTWLDTSINITTYIGLLSAGIAIALKEVFSNVAAWVFITVRKPFDVGHRIIIGEQRGDIVDIRMFQFSMGEVSDYDDGEQSTGRIIDVPNHFIFIHPLINYTKGFEFIWNEIKVLLTFESDWERAKVLLTEIVNKDSAQLSAQAKIEMDKASQKYMLHYKSLTPIVYTDVKDSGIQLTLRYLCTPKQRRGTINTVWTDILKMVGEEEHIDLAYPTRRIIN